MPLLSSLNKGIIVIQISRQYFNNKMNSSQYHPRAAEALTPRRHRPCSPFARNPDTAQEPAPSCRPHNHDSGAGNSSQYVTRGKKQLDGCNRNRQFELKVENINKIHDQISSLLSYVKSGESKSLLKNKQIVEKAKNKYENILGQKKQNQVRISEDGGKTLRHRRTSRSPCPKEQQPRAIRKEAGKFISKQNRHYKYDNNYVEDSLDERECTDIDNDYKFKSVYRVNKSESTAPSRNVDKMGRKDSENVYIEEISDEGLKVKYLEGRKDRRIDYQYEIEKVREKIQSSQKVIKKIEQRYPGYLRNQSMFDNFNRQQKHQAANHSRPQRPSTPSRRQFKLTLYPCQTEEAPGTTDRRQVRKVMADKFLQQIKLDERLVNARIRFGQETDEQKWGQLQRKLAGMGVDMTVRQLERQLRAAPDDTPAYTHEPSNDDLVEQMADAFIASEQNWQKEVTKFIPAHQLQLNSFRVQQLDLDHKGYLCLSDIVRFVNSYGSSIVKNRDGACLYRRMLASGASGDGIQYQTFMDVISY